MEKQYIINEKTLLTLLTDSYKLAQLESAGVDNWCWYGEGQIEYVAECLGKTIDEVRENSLDFRDIALKAIENFYCYKDIEEDE